MPVMTISEYWELIVTTEASKEYNRMRGFLYLQPGS